MKYIGLFSRVGYAIGNSETNDLLIKNKEDLKHFKDTTLNKIVIMGRKTIESLPKKLEDRFVICITRDTSYTTDKADAILTAVEDVLLFCEDLGKRNNIKEAFICGGAEVLNIFRDNISEHIVTEFDELTHQDVIRRTVPNIVLLPVSIREHLVFWTRIVTYRGHEFNVVQYTRGFSR